MYVNWDKHLLYLASPRSASVATCDALKTVGFSSFRGHHDGLDKAGVLFSKDTRSRWTTIATVRNHWDTVVSWMYWGQRGAPFSIRDFEKGLANAHKWILYDRLFLHADGVDVLWHFESLPADMTVTLSTVGLEMPQDI